MNRLEYKVYFRNDIAGLRALAVLSVLLAHAFPDVFQGRVVGVDIFFVISGYLITMSLLQLSPSMPNLMRFYAKRIIKIFPTLLISFSCLVIVGWYLYVYLGLGDSKLIYQSFLHTWFIDVEIKFYLLWPMVIWGARIFRFNLVILCVSLIFFSLAIELYSPCYEAFPNRLWELSLGALPALSIFEKSKKIFERLSFLSLIIIFVTIFIAGTNKIDNPWIYSLITCLTSVSLIISEKSPGNQIILSQRFLVKIGSISYSLYLWHLPIFIDFRLLSQVLPQAMIIFLSVMLTFIMAFLTDKFVEKNLRYYLVSARAL